MCKRSNFLQGWLVFFFAAHLELPYTIVAYINGVSTLCVHASPAERVRFTNAIMFQHYYKQKTLQADCVC